MAMFPQSSPSGFGRASRRAFLGGSGTALTVAAPESVIAPGSALAADRAGGNPLLDGLNWPPGPGVRIKP
jgi:hypothetical protein